MKRPTVIHNAGSLNIDDVFRTTHIVRPGETIPSRTLDRYPGGKGLNQSTALARAGAPTRRPARTDSSRASAVPAGALTREGDADRPGPTPAAQALYLPGP